MFEPAKEGFRKGQVFGAMLDEYYKLRGWGPDGAPAADKLRELNLPPGGRTNI
jgi:aldehyde:ferredoxin oxidoreductase